MKEEEESRLEAEKERERTREAPKIPRNKRGRIPGSVDFHLFRPPPPPVFSPFVFVLALHVPIDSHSVMVSMYG